MQVPFQLLRRPTSEPASALLLLSTDANELLSVCAELGSDPPPEVFSTADGMLLLLDAPTVKSFPHTLRLRNESKYLVLPVDADLGPRLHAEEAAALTRECGLIILPGNRTLAFGLRT